MKFRYGISDISIMQFGKSLEECRKIATEIGYDGFQSLPLKHGVTGLEDKTLCYEDVWSPELEHFWQINPKRAFDDLLQLFLLFEKGKKRLNILKNYKNNKITKISHVFGNLTNLEDDTLFEISPVIGISKLEEIKLICKDKQILVIDTKHISEYESLGSELNYENVIFQLAKNLAPVFHFQPIYGVDDFIGKSEALINEKDNHHDWGNVLENNIFKNYIRILKENIDSGIYKNLEYIDIVVEYNPKFAFFDSKKSEFYQKEMLFIVKKLVEKYWNKN